MTKIVRLLATAIVLVPLTACDIPFEPAAPEVPDVPEVPEVPEEVPNPEAIAAQLEDALFDKLQCEEIVRPSTLARMRALLRDPTFDEVEALLTNPQDLATVVAMAGVEVEGAVIIARNLERLFSNGTARQLVDGGWDGVQCGEPVDFACTAGDETTIVSCDADGSDVSAVTTDFALCTLGGTVHDGAMTFDRIADVTTSARVSFASLAFDEVKVLDGSLAVSLEDGAGFGATAGDDGIAYIEHGGPDGGVSCGARLSLDALELAVDDDETRVEFAGERVTVDDALSIATTSALRFAADASCACPSAGGGIRVEVPRPLGRAGESATAEIAFVASSDPALCAEANVTLVGWPSTCEVGGDCAKSATQATLGKLVSALCTSVP